MNLSDLQRKGLVEKFVSSPEQVRTELANSRRNLKSARKMLEIDEWGHSQAAAYTSMLFAARGLMFSKGYRPQGHEHHVATVSFAHVYERRYSVETLAAFERGRKMRNEFQYDDAGVISEERARGLVGHAAKFASKTREILKQAEL